MECIDPEFNSVLKRLCKEVGGQEQRNDRKARNNCFQESLNLSLTNFSEMEEVLGRSKPLRRSISEGITLSNKCGRDPRNGLAGKAKVEAFEYFKKYSKLEERVSSGREI
jgi:hypothetical protein